MKFNYFFQIIDQKINDYNARKYSQFNENDGKKSNIFIDECLKLSLETKCFSIEDVMIEAATMMSGVRNSHFTELKNYYFYDTYNLGI